MTIPDGLLVFASPFNEALDDYEPDYSVYFLPWSEARRLHGSWDKLTDGAELRGHIPTQAVDFDETRRFFVRTSVVDHFAKPS